MLLLNSAVIAISAGSVALRCRKYSTQVQPAGLQAITTFKFTFELNT